YAGGRLAGIARQTGGLKLGNDGACRPAANAGEACSQGAQEVGAGGGRARVGDGVVPDRHEGDPVAEADAGAVEYGVQLGAGGVRGGVDINGDPGREWLFGHVVSPCWSLCLLRGGSLLVVVPGTGRTPSLDAKST